MQSRTIRLFAVSLGSVLFSAGISAQDQSPQEVFDTLCATCHVQQAVEDEKMPSLSQLQGMSANAILLALTDGAMRLQGNTLSSEQRIGVSEFLSGGEVIERPITFDTGMCESLPAITTPADGTVWTGWGVDEKNTRYQTNGGLDVDDIGQLELKWAFAIPDVVQVRAQPAIYGDHLFVGSLSGAVFALDANTGCSYWSFKTEAGVRTAISVAEIDVDGENRTAIFFNDLQANVYALDAETGAEIWRTKSDDHPAAIGTGALKYHDGVLYVPTSGLPEEGSAPRTAGYDCCTFRGSILALEAATGEQIWKTYTLPEAEPFQELSNGKTLYGPAGVAIWNAPTVDAERGLLYIATGNAYVAPLVETSNAIIALDLNDGQIVWINQTLPEDIWSGGCYAGLGGDPNAPGCPAELGPDFDFSASPILTTTPSGRDVVVATQKSGLGFAFDPDNGGETLWTYRWGVGAAAGGVYGAAIDENYAYFAIADNWTEAPGGLHAVNLETGLRAWFTPPGELLCEPSTTGCSPLMSAAVTTIPGAVIAGSGDGGLRIYDRETGRIIWTYDTNRDFETVNGLPASGGSIDGPGAIVANGMIYVTAGNGGPFGMPGNVLLAFSVDGE